MICVAECAGEVEEAGEEGSIGCVRGDQHKEGKN